MKRKYYAYWCVENKHWAIKPFQGNDHFLSMVKQALEKCPDIGGYILPFIVDMPSRRKEPNWISHRDEPLENPNAIGNHPALLHIKQMMNNTDWLKG